MYDKSKVIVSEGRHQLKTVFGCHTNGKSDPCYFSCGLNVAERDLVCGTATLKHMLANAILLLDSKVCLCFFIATSTKTHVH